MSSRRARDSVNPFFATQNSMLGMKIESQANKQFYAPPVNMPQSTVKSKGEDLSFMFETESGSVVRNH